MTSTRLSALLAASAKLSPAERRRAMDDILAWRAVAGVVRGLHERSKNAAWPPPTASYGSWPPEHVAAATLRVLLTAHGSKKDPATANELLRTHRELSLWLGGARLYPVLSRMLARLDDQMKAGQPSTFESLSEAEVFAIAQSVTVEGRTLEQAEVAVPERPLAIVGSVGGVLKLVREAPEQATAAGTAATREIFDHVLHGDGSLAAEWPKRVRFVAHVLDSGKVQSAIGECQGARAISDLVLAGLVGVSDSTVRRRSVDVSKLLPSTFKWT